MTKQQKTVLNMAKFIQAQSLLLLEKLNELDFDAEADLCEKLHEDTEQLFCTLAIRLDALQGDLYWPAYPLARRHVLSVSVAQLFTSYLNLVS